VLVSDLVRSVIAGRRRRLSVAALATAGLTAAVVLTSAGSSGAATARTVKLHGGTTLTGTSVSGGGQLTLRFNYTTPHGKANMRVLAFNGHSNVKLKQPVLVFVLNSANPQVTKAAGPASTLSVKPGPRLIVIVLKLKPGARNFHGVLTGHDLVPFRHANLTPGETLSMTLANTVGSGPHGVRTVRPFAQVGLELGPSFR
jgi:hypothetical protein